MHLSVNLRDDLAKLSDIELAERLEAAWQTYDSIRKPWVWWGPLWRGPFRHPRAYRFQSLLGCTDGSWLGLVLAALFSDKTLEQFWRRSDPAFGLALTINEIQDLMDEMELRVSGRRAAKETTP